MGTRRLSWIGLAVALVACSPKPGPKADAAPAASSAASQDLCAPGESRCESDDEVASCAEDRRAFRRARCEGASICAAGRCVSLVAPGDRVLGRERLLDVGEEGWLNAWSLASPLGGEGPRADRRASVRRLRARPRARVPTALRRRRLRDRARQGGREAALAEPRAPHRVPRRGSRRSGSREGGRHRRDPSLDRRRARRGRDAPALRRAPLSGRARRRSDAPRRREPNHRSCSSSRASLPRGSGSACAAATAGQSPSSASRPARREIRAPRAS